MKIDIEVLDNSLVVILYGEIDHHHTSLIKEKIDQALYINRKKNLIFDFSHVTFMDSAGIGMLLGRYRQVAERDGQVSILHMNPEIKRIYDMSGLNSVMKHLDNIEDATNF